MQSTGSEVDLFELSGQSSGNANEVWKTHPDHPSYEFSNLGRARSFCNGSKPRLISGYILRGHRRIELRGENGFARTQTMLHRLIAELFWGPCPNDKDVVCHRNGDPDDNRADNLYWGTFQENSFDRHNHNGTSKGGKRSRPRKRIVADADVQKALRDRLVFAIQTGTDNETITIPMSLAVEIIATLTELSATLSSKDGCDSANTGHGE